MSRTGVASNRVLFHHGIKPAVLVIEDGLIVDVLDRSRSIGVPVEDVGDLLVMPALIDTNVHVSDPGRPEWEGFASATAAAAAGGVAVIADMPFEAVPPTISVAKTPSVGSVPEPRSSQPRWIMPPLHRPAFP